MHQHEHIVKFNTVAQTIWNVMRFDEIDVFVKSGMVKDYSYSKTDRTQVGCRRSINLANGATVVEKLETWLPNEQSFSMRELQSYLNAATRMRPAMLPANAFQKVPIPNAVVAKGRRQT